MENIFKEYRRAFRSFLYFERKFNDAKKIETKEKWLRLMIANQKYRDLIFSKMETFKETA